MPHGDYKKDSDRRGDILKVEGTSERKTRQQSEEMDDKTNAMECHVVWITDMFYEKRRYKKTGAFDM